MKKLLFLFSSLPLLLIADPIVSPDKNTDLIDRVPEVDLVKKDQKKDDKADDPAPEEKAPEKVSIHTIEAGGTLGQISEKAYGRTRYWRLLKLYNKCDPGKLKVGQTIKAPELPWLLESCGLKGKFPTVAEGLLKIKNDLMAIEDARPKKDYSEEELAKIDQLGTLVGTLSAALQQKTKGVKSPPYATLKQLRTCRGYLNKIAAKKKAGRRNLNALAHEHLSNAMVYAILWSQNKFK